MSRRAQRSKLCPTPSKARYYTEDEAAEAGARASEQIIRSRRTHRPFYVYLCDCRTYHLTHHRYRRDGGGAHRRATP